MKVHVLSNKGVVGEATYHETSMAASIFKYPLQKCTAREIGTSAEFNNNLAAHLESSV